MFSSCGCNGFATLVSGSEERTRSYTSCWSYIGQCSLDTRVKQLFALINETHAETYRNQLAEEVEPQITELASRAEKGIKLLERKETLLTSKVSELDSPVPNFADGSSVGSCTKPCIQSCIHCALHHNKETQRIDEAARVPREGVAKSDG